MNKKETIIKEISSAMRDAIIDAVSFNESKVEKEFYYGNAFVVVEMGYEMKNGWLIPVTEVNVLHDDDMHRSPLLEGAITEALPNWDKLEKEYGYVEQEESCFSYYIH